MKNIFTIILVMLLSYWSINSLLQNGFFQVHDNVQVERVFEMHKSLSDGMFPVRWVADLGYGYGYPIFNFYAPLAYYIGGFINFIVNDALLATKIMIGASILLSGVTMYFLAKEFWGVRGGILSALFYVYAPYHALNIYVRGAIAESWAYAFIPLVFLGLYKVYTNANLKNKYALLKYGSISAIGYSGVILSHNLTALMITPFILLIIGILIVGLYKENKRTSILYLLYSFLLGLLLSAFYWLPSLAEMQYTNVASQVGGGADFRDHFVCLGQLWNSPWGFGGSVPGCIDGMSYKAGKLHIILAIIGIILSMFFFQKNKRIIMTMIISIISMVIAIFLMLNVSQFIWELVGPMSYFQYPWRFLIVVSFITSFLIGSVIYCIENIDHNNFINKKLPLGIFFLTIIVLIESSAKLFMPQQMLNKSQTDYNNDMHIKWTASKISDEYMPKNFQKPQNSNQLIEKKLVTNAEIKSIVSKTQKIDAVFDSNSETTLQISTAFFPAWKVTINSKDQEIKQTKNGMLVSLPKGKSTFSLSYKQTPIEKFANVLSISGVALLLIGIIYARQTQQHE